MDFKLIIRGMWNDAPDAAPLYVKLAEIHSSLLPEKFAMNSKTVTPLALVDRALEKYSKYSKALHRKAKILFKLHKHEQGLVCLEAAFACGETNCDALCDLIFRLMRYPNRDKLDPIFQKYCSDYGENLWGKRKVGTIYYLCGNYLWMLNLKKAAVIHWLKAEQSNPNPMYFQKLHIQKTNYKWHQSSVLRYENIIHYLKGMKNGVFDRYARDSLLSKLQSLLDQ
ncbi:uncharacterized protein LOC110859812 [Folsomia candida]|uniref:uncharacterized protein LOC110859812 n=1 Tax=Folsomia candida TaxID=158441 RepID=UPI001605338F|nr:uncharacterized protein LOC110859812 [Folsomia candida]